VQRQLGDDQGAAEADVYLRQSRDFTGEERGISRQREDCTALLARRGWTLGVEHVDNDITASGKRKRPGFEALIARIAAGQTRIVVAWNLDRISRNASDRLRLLEAGRDRGLVLAMARGTDLDLSTPAGRLTAGILGEAAQYEIDQKGDRHRRAAQQRSQLGLPPLGVRLTGYTSAGELVPEEVLVVAAVFERFLSGDSLRSLAAWLTETGVPARHGATWHPSSVRTILTNPRYAGRAIYQGELTGERGQWEPLVTDEDFDAVQVKLGDPRRKKHQGTDRRHLGSGLYLCGACGDPVSSWSGHRYRCKKGCVTRVRPMIDEVVTGSIRARLARPDLADLLPSEDEPRIKELMGALTRLRSRLASIDGDYDSGLIDGRRHKVATEKVRAELDGVESQFAAATRGRETALLRSDDPVAAWDEASLTMRQAIVRALCDVRLMPAPRGRKTFDPDSVIIEWRA
jgi:site-specific DNA recombinase